MTTSHPSDARLESLQQTVADLQTRLGRLETVVAEFYAPARVVPPAQEPVLPPRVVPVPQGPVLPPAFVASPITPLEASTEPPVSAIPLKAFSDVPPPIQPARDLEATIGLNWAGWIGAIVFVLGVLFFLKYAWDQGWIHPTPTMRVITAIATGVAISAVGERMHRRGVHVLAATLHGAGLAIVLASFFGAYVLFEPSQRVLGIGAAFAGVVITASIGVLLALHIDSMVLAIIALLGAYLAPLVLNTGEDRSATFLAYLGVLAAIGCVLSYIRPRWIPLRVLVWIGTYLSYFAWWAGMGQRHDHSTLATLWGAVFYGGFLVEMILTLRKSGGGEIRLNLSTAILCLLNTAATFGMMRFIYDMPSDDRFLGFVALGLALAQSAAAFATPSREFSISSALQSAALVTLAVPLILNEFAITLAWLALAVALAVLAWQLKLSAARGWAIVLLLLSIARLFLFDGQLRNVDVVEIGSFTVSRWMLLAWGMAIFCHLVAWLRPGKPERFSDVSARFAIELPFPSLSKPRDPELLEYATTVASSATTLADPAGVFISIVGTMLFVGSTATLYTGSVLTLLPLLWLIPMVLLAHEARSLGYVQHAMILVALVTVKWIVPDEIQPISSHWNDPTGALIPFFNLPAINGALVCGLLFGLFKQWRPAQSSDRYALVVFAALIGLALLNFQACHAVDLIALHGGGNLRDPGIVKHVAMSIIWGASGFAAVIAGFRRNIAPLRYAALALLGLTLIKIFIVDMAEVKAVWRILSFIAVGGLLLGVSYLYHRQLERSGRLSG